LEKGTPPERDGRAISGRGGTNPGRRETDPKDDGGGKVDKEGRDYGNRFHYDLGIFRGGEGKKSKGADGFIGNFNGGKKCWEETPIVCNGTRINLHHKVDQNNDNGGEKNSDQEPTHKQGDEGGGQMTGGGSESLVS